MIYLTFNAKHFNAKNLMLNILNDLKKLVQSILSHAGLSDTYFFAEAVALIVLFIVLLFVTFVR